MPERKANKIVPFMQGAEFYFAKYRRKLEQGKYIDALCALRAACDKKPEDQEYALELAELYTEMDFYEESNYILLKLFPENPARQEECLYGMGCNFLDCRILTGRGNALRKCCIIIRKAVREKMLRIF